MPPSSLELVVSLDRQHVAALRRVRVQRQKARISSFLRRHRQVARKRRVLTSPARSPPAGAPDTCYQLRATAPARKTPLFARRSHEAPQSSFIIRSPPASVIRTITENLGMRPDTRKIVPEMCAQGLELLRESISGEFVYWLHRDLSEQEVNALCCIGGRPCEHGEWQVGCDGLGDDGVAVAEVARRSRQQGVEACWHAAARRRSGG